VENVLSKIELFLAGTEAKNYSVWLQYSKKDASIAFMANTESEARKVYYYMISIGCINGGYKYGRWICFRKLTE